MNDIPTPETDACYHHCVTHPGPGNGIVMRSKMMELERRLTVAREALQQITGLNEYLTVDIAEHGLKASEPSGREE